MVISCLLVGSSQFCYRTRLVQVPRGLFRWIVDTERAGSHRASQVAPQRMMDGLNTSDRVADPDFACLPGALGRIKHAAGSPAETHRRTELVHQNRTLV